MDQSIFYDKSNKYKRKLNDCSPCDNKLVLMMQLLSIETSPSPFIPFSVVAFCLAAWKSSVFQYASLGEVLLNPGGGCAAAPVYLK